MSEAPVSKSPGVRAYYDRAAHAGQLAESPLELAEEGASGSSIGIAGSGQRELKGEYIGGVETRPHLLQGDEAPHQEARADQEHHRQCHLAQDQQAAYPLSRAGRAGAPT